jgi:hypothetical protein
MGRHRVSNSALATVRSVMVSSGHGRLSDPPSDAGDSGSVVAFLYLPRVVGADKPPGWNGWLAAEKVEHLLGMSLDRVHDYLGWPPHELDPHRLAAQSQAVRVVVRSLPGRDRGAASGAGSGASRRAAPPALG